MIALILVLLAGCGKDEAALNLTGSYSGSESGTQAGAPFTATITATVTQTGNSISGTFKTSLDAKGTITATLEGSTLNALTVTMEAPCDQPLTGSGTVAGTTIKGDVSGTAGSCGAVVSHFEMTKQ